MPRRAVLLVIATTLMAACDHTPSDLLPPPPSGLIPPENHVPVAAITAPAMAEEGIGITFDGSGSSDADRDSLTFNWDLGDGSRRSGALVTHAYAGAGTYTVSLIVRDPRAAADSALMTVRITPANQVAIAGYEVIDLGSLGGNATVPLALNDLGQVVGASLTASGESHAFLWENGAMRDLAPELPSSSANLIVNSGAIAGAKYPPPGTLGGGVLLWHAGGQTFSVLNSDHPVALADAGDVVAVWSNDMGSSYSDLWHDGAKTPLGGLWGSTSSSAAAMNRSASIVGSSLVHEYAGREIRHAFLWQNGAMRDLGVLFDYPCDPDSSKACGQSAATAINANGDVLGISTQALYVMHAVLWRDGEIEDLGIGQPVALNDAGDVVLNAGSQVTIRPHGGSPQFLGSLGGDSTAAVAMNNSGVVTGSGYTASRVEHVFVWTPERMFDLGVGPAPARGARAIAINARGDILGYSYVEPCTVHATGGMCRGTAATGAAVIRPTRAILWRRKN